MVIFLKLKKILIHLTHPLKLPFLGGGWHRRTANFRVCPHMHWLCKLKIEPCMVGFGQESLQKFRISNSLKTINFKGYFWIFMSRLVTVPVGTFPATCGQSMRWEYFPYASWDYKRINFFIENDSLNHTWDAVFTLLDVSCGFDIRFLRQLASSLVGYWRYDVLLLLFVTLAALFLLLE